VPWALAFAEEQQMVEMEKEMKMRESGQEVRLSFCYLQARIECRIWLIYFEDAYSRWNGWSFERAIKWNSRKGCIVMRYGYIGNIPLL